MAIYFLSQSVSSKSDIVRKKMKKRFLNLLFLMYSYMISIKYWNGATYKRMKRTCSFVLSIEYSTVLKLLQQHRFPITFTPLHPLQKNFPLSPFS